MPHLQIEAGKKLKDSSQTYVSPRESGRNKEGHWGIWTQCYQYEETWHQSATEHVLRKLKPKNNNKNIYEATYVLGYIVKFKPLHPKSHKALTENNMAIQKASANEKRDASSV